MVDIVRYVNPLSSGGDGTTTALSGTNAAYASLSAAITAEATDLPTAGNTLRLKCFGAAEDTVGITWPAAMESNAANPLIIENATGESGGNPSLEGWDTSAYRVNLTVNTNSGAILDGVNDNRNLDYVLFKNIQIGGNFTGTGGGTQAIFEHVQSPWDGKFVFEDCVLRLSGDSQFTACSVIDNETAIEDDLKNCLLIVESYTGTAATRAATSETASSIVRANNNTVRGFSTGFAQSGGGTISLGNNLFEGNTTDTAGTISSLGGNTTDNANFGSMTSTGNNANRTYTFLSGTSSKLGSADTGATNQGVDLSADANLPVSNDAFGTSRPQLTLFDAGYHEKTSTDSTAPTFSVNPAFDSANGLTVTCDATASDESASVVDHFAVLVADGAAAPSSAQVIAGQDSTGSAAIDAANTTGISNGVEAQLQLDGAAYLTNYDVYWVARDPSGNATSPIKVDVATTAAPRIVTPAASSGVPGAIIACTLSNFSGVPTTITLNGVAANVSNLTAGGFNLTLPVLGSFVAGGSHQSTPWNTNINLVVTESGGSATAQIQVTPPDTDGPDYWYGAVTTLSPVHVLPAAAASGDYAFVERVSGTNVQISAYWAAGATSQDWSVNSRIWDTSANQWSGINPVNYSFSSDTTPNQFTFADQTNVALNTTIQSNTITIAGINAAAAISISSSVGATYSINGATPTASSGTVNNGDTVVVYLPSSANYSASTSATLVIGGVLDTFTVTTLAQVIISPSTPIVFDDAIYTVDEHTDVGDAIATLGATGGAGTLNYSIASGNDDDYLTLSAAGILSVAKDLVFNSVSKFVLKVDVTDGTSTERAYITIYVIEDAICIKTAEIIRDALQEIIVQASEQRLRGAETRTAIRYLNRMVTSWPFSIGYVEVDSTSDLICIPRYAQLAIILGLAILLAPQFDRPVPDNLRANFSKAYNDLLTRKMQLVEAGFSNNLPRGSGNKRPGDVVTKYYNSDDN